MKKDHLFKKGNTEGSKRKGRTFEKPLQKMLKDIITNYVDGDGNYSFEDDLLKMQPVDRARTISMMTPYILPKKSQMSIIDLQDEFAENLLNKIIDEQG